MKRSKRMRLLSGCALAMIICCMAIVCASAQSFSAQLNAGMETCTILSVEKDDGNYLLLPAFADLNELKITAHETGDSMHWQNEAGEKWPFDNSSINSILKGEAE